MSTSAVGSAPISISGLSSGLDTSSIIQALTTAESGAVTVEQNKQTTLNSQLTEWQNFNTSLASLQTQALGLSTVAAFDNAQVTSSNTQVATASVLPGATAGNHNLVVNALAQAQQVLSGSQADATAPLGLAGSFSINGHQVTVSASNTLSDVSTAINDAGAGVSASLLTISPGNVELSLTATGSGTINAISATDLGSGTVLQSLGLVAAGPATALRQAVTNGSLTGAGSTTFTGTATPIGTLLGTQSGAAPTGTIQINGVSVALNLNTMSLNDVASAINQAGVPNVTAQVVAIPNSSGNITPLSKQQLQITSSSGAITSSSFTDSNGVLASLGVVQSHYSSQVTAAQDASFKLDNVGFTRSTNSIGDVVPNVTMNLLSTGSSTLSVAQDTTTPINSIQSLVSAYNTVNDYINAQNTFTPTTSSTPGTAQNSPPLFGDYTLISIQQQLAQTLATSSGGQTLQSIGITTGQNGDLTVDSGKLTTALQTNPTAVYNLFGATGTASNSLVQFVSANTNTHASSGSGYQVAITTAASQASITAGTAQTGPSTSPETLSFSGLLFGNSTFNLTVPSGSSEQNIVDLINGNSNINQRLFASIDPATNALNIKSKAYGANASFTVDSNLAASATNSGLGNTVLSGTGVDVAGTIGGEAATGIGQTLSGNPGNLNTNGLVLTILATNPGVYGAVSVNHGASDQLNTLINNLTTSSTSAVQAAEGAINSQLTDIGTTITQMQAEASTYQQQLTTEFSDMETTLASLKSQSSAFLAEIGSVPTSSPTASSTSSSTKAG